MYEYRCRLVKVVDGDTVDVDIDLGFDCWLRNQRVRLYGIDAPESRTRDLVEKVFGNLAKSFVEDALTSAEHIVLSCKTYDASGKYGRILGDFWVPNSDVLTDGELLCEAMIREHLAAPYFGQSKDDIQEAHLANRQYLLEHDPLLMEWYEQQEGT